MSVALRLPDDAWLLEQAGDAAFKRGTAYFRDARIALGDRSDGELEGEAHGSASYRWRLRFERGEWDGQCDCPAAADGSFCKHLVAAVLTARADQPVVGDVIARPVPSKREPPLSELREFLRAQPVDRLADWLLRLADEDRVVEKRLLLYRATSEPGALKAALAKVLTVGPFMDYRRTVDFSRRLGVVVEQLHTQLAQNASDSRGLCEYALKRLLGAVERCDDSSGMLGGRMAEIAELHAQACVKAPPGMALVKPLLALQRLDHWGLLPLARYWDALGGAGQADYTRTVVDEFEKLPPPKKHSFDLEGIHVCRRVEALARCSRDFDLLQRVLRRDLSSANAHHRVLRSLREFGRAREALAWAEAAVKRFPEDGSLRAALAECLGEAGLDEEALEQVWQRFQHAPSKDAWDGLKRWSGERWPSWRLRALEQIAEREHGGQASLRVTILMHDGDLDGALALAQANPVHPETLLQLAARISGPHAAIAGAFYLRVARFHAEGLRGASDYAKLVDPLARAAALLPKVEWQPVVAEVRAAHARKTRLMAMLDEAGL